MTVEGLNLREIGPGLKELARAIESASAGSLGVALKAAYQAGLVDGTLTASIALVVIYLLFGRRSRE